MATVVVKHHPSGGPADPLALVDGPTYDADPHIVTGLENVDNTSDLNKPISTATQTALGTKAHTFTLTTTGSSGAATYTADVLNIPQYSGLTTGGTSGQVQYNNSGVFGGFTVSGDATLNTGTGALTLAAVNSNVGSFGSATAVGTFTVDGKGRLTAAGSTTITPAVGSVTGLGTGVATALGVNVGSAGAFVTFNGALGAPSSGTVTNLTGTASININGTVGATTPNTGAFTTSTASTSVSSPIHASSGAYTFQSNGSTFAGLIDTSQRWLMGNTATIPSTINLLLNPNTSATVPALPGGRNFPLLVAGADQTQVNVGITGFATNGFNYPAVTYLKARGTAASPTAIQSGDFLGANFAYGYYTSGGPAYAQSGAGFVFVATENFTSTATGTAIDLYITPTGTASNLPGLRLNASGGLSMAIAGTPVADPGNGNIAAGGSLASAVPTTKTANYTMLVNDSSLIFNGAGSLTLTLLAAATYPGRWLHIKTIAAQTVVSASSNVVPLVGGSAGTAILAATAGKWAELQSDGTNWIVMAGN